MPVIPAFRPFQSALPFSGSHERARVPAVPVRQRGSAASANSDPVATASIAQDEKRKARERIQMIKARIQALRGLLHTVGGKVAAAVVRELRELGAELEAAAATLEADGEAASTAPVTDATPPQTATPQAPQPEHGADGGGFAAYSEQQGAADAQALAARPDHAERDADDKEISAVSRLLRALLSEADAMARQEQSKNTSA